MLVVLQHLVRNLPKILHVVIHCDSIGGTGEWDQATLTLKLIVWRDFFFKNDFAGRSLAGALYESSFAYLIKFKEILKREVHIVKKPLYN